MSWRLQRRPLETITRTNKSYGECPLVRPNTFLCDLSSFYPNKRQVRLGPTPKQNNLMVAMNLLCSCGAFLLVPKRNEHEILHYLVGTRRTNYKPVLFGLSKAHSTWKDDENWCEREEVGKQKNQTHKIWQLWHKVEVEGEGRLRVLKIGPISRWNFPDCSH